MNLKTILDNTSRVSSFGSLDKDITSLTVDSRAVTPGCLFAAIRGEKADGHDFIDIAREAGAAAILAEKDTPELYRDTWLRAPDTRQAIAEAADVFYGFPSDELLLSGITGTNGKTTTAFLLHHLLESARGRAGLIGTVKYLLGDGEAEPASHTTPDWITVQRLLRTMRDNGCAAAAMEVSSHAIHQKRVAGLRFNTVIFTNLTQDHLDYHGTMEEYFLAKAALVEHLLLQGGKKKPTLVVNTDDTYGRRLAKMYDGKLRIVTFGMGVGVDFRVSDLRAGMRDTSFQLEARGRKFLVKMPLIGRFNVYNALGAVAAAWAMDLNLREAVNALANAPQIPGRLQSIAENKPFRVFVDYAHTPDALENALKTLKDLGPRRIITVFGCGGDRDRRKRPIMGAVSEGTSAYTILTNDNPRSEEPAEIIAEIRAGMRGTNHEVIEDRKAAIQRAISLAGGGDIVLIAGKGHELGQTAKGVTNPFDDVSVTRSLLRAWTLPERL